MKDEITSVINRNSGENESNTPDFIIGDFIMDSLAALNKAVNAREEWYGRATGIEGAPPLVHKTSPSAALFAFAAWLTTRKEATILGSNHDAAPIAKLVGDFCDSQGWANPPEGWEQHFQPYPKG